MTIARSANIRAMLDNYSDASAMHREAVSEAIQAAVTKLREYGYTELPDDDRLAEVEGVVSNYLWEAGWR